MAEVEGQKFEFEMPKPFKYLLTTLVAGTIWISGFATYCSTNNVFHYPDEYYNLSSKKTELTKKIDGWNRFIPLMKEQFASQCKDSLEKAVKDTSEINLKMAEIEKEHDKLSGKAYYSWLAYFMD
ncbi:MAG: hypothetical protein AABW57_01225 [Nanoarchaeota archaeon]